nr:hypothetical protein [uncultured Anaeromusa sp.]
MLISNPTNIEAVNSVLGSIGDSPVETLEKATNVNVILAGSILEKALLEVQSKGFTFNITEGYVLNIDSQTKRIPWNSSFLRLEDPSHSLKLVRRNGYVYNLTDQTYEFQGTTLIVDLIQLITLEDLPIPARSYVIALASERFQRRVLGDPQLDEELKRERVEAWVDLQHYETETNDYNIFENPDVQAIARVT